MNTSAGASIGDRAVYDPLAARSVLLDAGYPVDSVGGANSYTCPLGRGPGIATLLMIRADLDAMDLSAYHTLTVECGQKLEVAKMTAQTATCICPAGATDSQRLYRVQFADRRYRLMQRQVSLFTANMRDPEVPASFFSSSLNSGSQWTWTTLLTHLWTQNAELGAWPGFPAGFSAPANNPENLQWSAVSYFEMLCDALEKVRLIVRFNPTVAGTAAFSIVRWSGGTDAAYDAAIAAATPIDDAFNVSSYIAVPYRVIVQFPRQQEGLSREVRAVNPTYDVEAGSDALLVASGFQVVKLDTLSRVVLTDSMTARFSAGGTVQNQSTLQARADELAADWYKRLQGVDWPPAKRTVYKDVRSDILPGAKAERVTWGDCGTGWKTEVSSSPPMLPRLKTSAAMTYGASTRLVKIVTGGAYPQVGQRMYRCEVYTVAGSESEGAVVTLTATGEIIYAATFRASLLIFGAYYLAVSVAGVWVIDNQATFVEDVV